MGHITHAGNDRVRTTLVEFSWILIGKDPAMRWKYNNIKHRRGGKRAIVAVARTLSACTRRVLLHQVPYKIGLHKAIQKSFNHDQSSKIIKERIQATYIKKQSIIQLEQKTHLIR